MKAIILAWHKAYHADASTSNALRLLWLYLGDTAQGNHTKTRLRKPYWELPGAGTERRQTDGQQRHTDED
jgi:hypothetical protein